LKPALNTITLAAALAAVTAFTAVPASAELYAVSLDGGTSITAAQALGDDLQVQLTLGGQDGLVQFRVHLVHERRVLVMQRRQAGGDFFLLALDGALERRVDAGLGGRVGAGRRARSISLYLRWT